jgi:hypothetical protein
LNFLELSEFSVESVPWRLVARMGRKQLLAFVAPHLRWATSIPLQRFLLSKRPIFRSQADGPEPVADISFLDDAGFADLTAGDRATLAASA